MLIQVKGGLFLLKLEIHCICRNPISAKNKKNLLIPVSDVGVSAVYDLVSMYFISFACSLGTTIFCL